MLILFDHGTPKGLARTLSAHSVHTPQAKGWDTLSNGALLDAAGEAGFELLLRSRVQQHADRIVTAVASATPGSYSEVEIAFESKPRRA